MEYVEAIVANPSGGALAAEFDMDGRSLAGDGALYHDWVAAASDRVDEGTGCTVLVLTLHRHYPGDDCAS